MKKCKDLNNQVEILNNGSYFGNYFRQSDVKDNMYYYWRQKTDRYNTHFTVVDTDSGNADFEKFFISFNFGGTQQIRSAHISYAKGIRTGYNTDNLWDVERETFEKLYDTDRDHFDSMAAQFWNNLQNSGTIGFWDDVRMVKNSVEDELMAIPGVTGVDIGYKIVDNFTTNEHAIIVYIENIADVYVYEKIPPTIQGISTDIREGSFTYPTQTKRESSKFWNSDIMDTSIAPICGGYSIGPCGANLYGTLGIIFTYQDIKYILSNTHVLLERPPASPGSPICHPTVNFGGDIKNSKVGEYVGGFIGERNVDASVARIIDDRYSDAKPNYILELKETAGIAVAMVDMEVEKFGRSTLHTKGKVVSTDYTSTVTYPNFGTFIFKNQLRIASNDPIRPFSIGGDSGSIIVNKQKQIVGMILGTTVIEGKLYTIAHPIQDVINAFDGSGSVEINL
ncbi:MAG: hypothetical protein AAGA77_11710 [Bacteroidota bacterium]